ncbi:hypothetical protein HanRHA438_Chr03g0129101 [Helianthus annuus]|nr:hypothetical protein HanRHA438_Chr03g0129101 [Helianthus annuus]
MLTSFVVTFSSRPSGERSHLVTTASVLCPVLSTRRDMHIDSHVVKSTEAERTFKMMLSSGFMYSIIIP